jgi:hypothetical protein
LIEALLARVAKDPNAISFTTKGARALLSYDFPQNVRELERALELAVALAGPNPSAPDTVLVTASTGPRTDRAAVYRRPLEGGKFVRAADGLPDWFGFNLDSHCLAASGGSVVLGARDGRIYRSGDSGRTWEQVLDDLPALTCVVIAES